MYALPMSLLLAVGTKVQNQKEREREREREREMGERADEDALLKEFFAEVGEVARDNEVIRFD